MVYVFFLSFGAKCIWAGKLSSEERLKSDFPIEMGELKENQFEIGSIELNKKRKLQEDQLGLPLPKLKFRDRSCGSEEPSPITHDKENEDNMDKCRNNSKADGGSSDRLEQCESVKDSNSFVDESDTAMYVDVQTETQTGNGTNFHDQPLISSSSSSINNYGNNFYSPASAAIKSMTNRTSESDSANLGNDPLLDQGFPLSKGCIDELGINYADLICSEYLEGKEQCLDMAAEEMMLYSNDVLPNLYVLSSGRWNVNPGEILVLLLLWSWGFAKVG